MDCGSFQSTCQAIRNSRGMGIGGPAPRSSVAAARRKTQKQSRHLAALPVPPQAQERAPSSGPGFDQLEHLKTEASGAPFTVERPKDRPSRGLKITFGGCRQGLLIEGGRLQQQALARTGI
jgi:hypothetical protein